MNLLAFDTATDACTVALQWQGKVFSEHVVAPREHHHLLLANIKKLLQEKHLSLKKDPLASEGDILQAIVCGIGPGSFVGTRMAVGIAQGLALGADLKVIPISTLQTVAEGVYREYGHEKVMVAQDAHMQKTYVGLFQLQQGCMQPLVPEALIALSELALQPQFVAVGNAWKNEKAIEYLPHAIDMLTLAPFAKACAPEEVFPSYLDDAGFWKKAK